MKKSSIIHRILNYSPHIAIALICSFVIIVGTLRYNQIYINTDSSLPQLLWKKTDKPWTYDTIVSLCLSDQQYEAYYYFQRPIDATPCDGFTPILKPIIGLPGDPYTLDENGITIKNTLIDDTKPMQKIPQFGIRAGVVPDKHFLVGGPGTTHLDSRYFGVIHQDQIRNTLTPLF